QRTPFPKRFGLPSPFWAACPTTGPCKGTSRSSGRQWGRGRAPHKALANNGAVEGHLTKLHFPTRLSLSFVTTASCGAASGLGPCQGLLVSAASAPLDLKKEFLETPGLGQRNFHGRSGGARAFPSHAPHPGAPGPARGRRCPWRRACGERPPWPPCAPSRPLGGLPLPERLLRGRRARAAMRFRAKIVDLACLNHFSRIINTIAKLAKTCILRLTVCKLYFILSDKVANGGASMWCELSQGNFFDEFQMEGVAAEHNEIYLELVPENLSRALKTAQNAKAVKIKLTNKHCPCLSVAVELPSLSSSSRIVTHDIPVGVIPRRMWNDFREPSVPDFDVSLCFYIPY
uniref:HUS1 checkpoint clamp component n=1 Tax=Ficedula albicollis TaxID=59894 RepID=A0A803VEA1_FICAL